MDRAHRIRRCFCVDCFHIVMGQNDMFLHLIPFKLTEITGDFCIVLQIFINRENRYGLRLLIPDAYTVQGGYGAIGPALIYRGLDLSHQNGAFPIDAGVHIWIEYGLTPGACIRCHDRCDYIDQLGQAGDLHSVRMSQHGDQHASYQKRVFKVIDILQLVRRLIPRLDFLVLLVAVIPHVPLVKG